MKPHSASLVPGRVAGRFLGAASIRSTLRYALYCAAGLLGLLAAGCAVGPNYHRPAPLPSEPVPDSFSAGSAGATHTALFEPAQPSAHLERGAWWEIFGDPELARLEELAVVNNQDLAAAAARLDQARALMGEARANLFPQIAANPWVVRQRTSANAPISGQPAGAAYTYSTLTVPISASWELDLWGRVRRLTEQARAQWAASADDFESARLAVRADVASDYFLLRALDAERSLVADTIETFRRSLELTQNRRQGGVASDLDVSQAETQLRATEAELPALDLQRANVLHALATLCGKSAAGFKLGAAPLLRSVPSVPAALPSELLERRPDIAAAERRMAAANAGIGVAQGAFYPRVVLNGLAGLQSVDASTWLDWPSRLWAIGPSVTLPIFTGGYNRAQLALARGAYAESVASYRQTVLAAFQEVEDQLAGQRLLAAQLDAQYAALTSARHTLEIATNRYKAGLVTYLEVATAQNASLANETAVVQLQGRRLVTEIALIRALGGGWTAPDGRN